MSNKTAEISDLQWFSENPSALPVPYWTATSWRSAPFSSWIPAFAGVTYIVFGINLLIFKLFMIIVLQIIAT